MPPKRPLHNVFGDEDQAAPKGGQNGQQRQPDGPKGIPAGSAQQPKRARMTPAMLESNPPSSTLTSPSPSTAVANGTTPSANSVQAQIAAARAKIDAQMAALRSRQQGATPATASASSSTSNLPPSAPKVASSALPPTSAASSNSSSSLNLNMENIRKQIAEAKAKAALLSANQGRQAADQTARASPVRDESKPSGIHPLLMANGLNVTASRPTSSKSANASWKASVPGSKGHAAPEVPKVNPYLAEADETATASGSKGRSMHRQLQFNRAGRYVKAAEEARHEAELEALKKRIAEKAKKAGLQDELTGEDRKIKRQPPPDVEWWDASLLPQGSYDCVPEYPPTEAAKAAAVNNTKVTRQGPSGDEEVATMPLILSEGTPIDPYIQHPIPIPDPTEKFKVQPKGVILTKQEMKKMRKQRRAAEREDKQDRIKMGLQAPDPPKVKLSNLMRVLTSEQVADPTKIEARVRREVAARREQHERTNAERALTDEQRREKRAQKQEQDESKGLQLAVYKVKHLVSPAHKFKVRKNAVQDGLTGLTVIHSDFALIVVEGAAKGMKHYRKLMLDRIRWDDPGRRREDNGGGSEDEEHQAAFLGPMGDAPPVEEPTQSLEDIEWSKNYCELIFEGPARDRIVASGMKARTAADDYEAKEILGSQWAGFWDVAKRMETAREELL